MTKKNLFWFRQDLRLFDNPGLYEASKTGNVMPIYILDEDRKNNFKIGGASCWWLYNSLSKLNKKLDGKLNVYKGNSRDTILRLIKEHHIDAVYWNRCYESFRIKDDFAIKSELKKTEIRCKSFNASLLWEPWETLKSDGTPYRLFTPFYQKGCLHNKLPREPLPIAEKVTFIKDPSNSTSIETLELLSATKWYSSMGSSWIVGEDAAHERFKDFLRNGLHNYKEGRNFPSEKNTSRLSPHLHFGEISPHYIWHTLRSKNTNEQFCSHDLEHFLSELGWREFSYYLLYHFQNLPHQNFQKKFDEFTWQTDGILLKKWQKGQTGYPIVDAGMRELWQTGYMHNRLRMIVGSFLVKNLLLHWHYGEKWFWDCLVDADLANNSASWQWVAGSGADAAPYFRIFNPVTQGEKFDPDGSYTKRFIPELRNMPVSYLFKPWEAPEPVLKEAGVILGQTYPRPIVDLVNSRKRAMKAFSDLSKKAG